MHADKASAEVIIQLMPLFKDLNFQSYASETPEELSLEDTINSYDNVIAFDQCVLKAESLQEPCVKAALLETNFDYSTIAHYDEEIRKVHEFFILHQLKENSKFRLESYEASKELLFQLGNNEINIHNIDLPRKFREKTDYALSREEDNDITIPNDVLTRDIYMKDNLIELCSFGNVLFLVGVGHYEIANLLRKQGYFPEEYYIVQKPASDDPGALIDYLLRVDSEEGNAYREKHFSGNIIDLHADPTLNAAAIVEKDLLCKVRGVCDDMPHDEL